MNRRTRLTLIRTVVGAGVVAFGLSLSGKFSDTKNEDYLRAHLFDAAAAAHMQLPHDERDWLIGTAEATPSYPAPLAADAANRLAADGAFVTAESSAIEVADTYVQLGIGIVIAGIGLIFLPLREIPPSPAVPAVGGKHLRQEPSMPRSAFNDQWQQEPRSRDES